MSKSKNRQHKLWHLYWNRCTQCPIGSMAYKHVLYTGPLDTRAVFIGEGPGKAEDTIGKAFIGRAGILLRQAIMEAGEDVETMGFTNIVACRPTDSRDGPNRQPSQAEAHNCRPRLVEILKIVQPTLIFLCGKIPQHYQPNPLEWLDKGGDIDRHVRLVNVVHPAYVGRQGPIGSDSYKRYVKDLQRGFKGTDDDE